MKSYKFLFVVICVLSASTVWAQMGTISGKVTDDNGQPLPGAIVSVEGTDLSVSANADGEYKIEAIAPGTYTVNATTYSYRPQTASVTVTAGQSITQDFTLSIDLLNLEQIIVTGTFSEKKNIESSLAITTLSQKELEQSAPRSTTEYLRRVPGFTRVESSGGNVNENLQIRGLLGVESVSLQEDGMPVYPTMHIFFMNADNLIRPDLNVNQVQILRGGSSPIFGSSTTGAIVNFINATGEDDLVGVVKGTVGTEGLARFDFNVNGPLIGDDWRFNIGGFYRYDHGVRDPGFPGIQGGQLKANVTRILDNGFFRISGRYLDDKNQFILPLPFQNPDDPEYVSGFGDYGSFNTPEGIDLRVPLPPGNDDLVLPLDRGINTQGGWLTGHIYLDFADNWNFENIARVMSVDHQNNALVPGDFFTSGVFTQRTIDDLILRGFVPPGSTGQFFFTNVLDPLGNPLPFDTANGLVATSTEWHVEKPISDFSDLLQIRKVTGRHNLAFGTYFAFYTQGNVWNFTDVLTNVADNPNFLDFIVTTPDGQTFDYTKDGFIRFLPLYRNGNGNTTLFAFFASDEFQITDRLRIDGGIRWEQADYLLRKENLSTFDLDGNPNTLYDIEQFGNRTFTTIDTDKDDVAYSVGFNYQLRPDRLAIYGSFARGFKMPALDEFLDPAVTQQRADIFEPFHTYMLEGGVKYTGPVIGYTASAYWGKVFNVTSQGLETDPITGFPVFVIRQQPDTTGWGFEFEVITRPLQNTQLRASTTTVDVTTPAGAQAPTFYDGFTVAVADFEAIYTIAQNTNLLFDWHYVGERFSNPAKTIKLDAYNYFNIGAAYAMPNRGLTFAVRLLNLTQSKGFEEGNPRVDQTRLEGRDLFLARPLLPRRLTVEVQYGF